ncbi:hypothetical protein JXA56_00565 [Candidatus Micrarchaeota archaeon]|nr:hypothetical protein [Candidatus Micrarchaeota archaeon]
MARAQAPKKRYILFENAGTVQDESRLKNALYDDALRFFGELGLSYAALKLVKFDGKHGIIRCSRDYQDKVLGFLALSPLRLKALKSSGTMKSLDILSEPRKSRTRQEGIRTVLP